MKVLLQADNSTIETRSIRQYAALVVDVEIKVASIDSLEDIGYGYFMASMPVGSVEFVQKFCSLAQIKIPEFDPYDPVIRWALCREVRKCQVWELFKGQDIFVKPVELKRFNGFVFKGFDYDGYDDHDLEQVDALRQYKLCDQVYVSDVVKFVAEWRIYVTNGNVVATCRYDDSDDEYDLNGELVDFIVEAFPGRTLAIDVGLIDNGKLAVVELNDAWAIGKYQGISNSDYFELLATRWKEIINA